MPSLMNSGITISSLLNAGIPKPQRMTCTQASKVITHTGVVAHAEVRLGERRRPQDSRIAWESGFTASCALPPSTRFWPPIVTF